MINLRHYQPGNVYFYPSVSATTVVSDYVKLPEVISYLKLRGSFATVHGDATSQPVLVQRHLTCILR
jgi:hypothetical protein